MAKFSKLGANPTMLSLLKAGCVIHFPNGYQLFPKGNQVREAINGLGLETMPLNKDTMKKIYRKRKSKIKSDA